MSYHQFGLRHWVPWLLIALVTLSLASSIVLADGYQYSVKVEQVEDARHIDMDEAVSVSNMTETQQQVLRDAFKEMDHLLGSAEATVETTTTATFSEGLHIVQTDGVSLLVSVDRTTLPTNRDVVFGFVFIAIGAFSLLVGLVGCYWWLDERR